MPKPAESNKWVLKHERQNYIYFSPLTTGASGKAVKIHKDLFLPFFCAVNPSTYDGQVVIRQIEQLRSTPAHAVTTGKSDSAGHVQRLQNVKDTFQHALMTKNVQVFYRIEQEAKDSSPVVYISQIRATHSDMNETAGLYAKKITYGATDGPVVKLKNKSIDGRTVFVNGLSKDVGTAMNQAEYAAGSKKNLALFYTPASVCNDLGTWNSQAHSYGTQYAIKELTEVLQHNQKAKSINWIVDGEGSAMLSNALQNVTGNLENHSFKLVNPKADTPKLLQNLTKKKANLTGEFFSYSSSEAALISLASHKEALIKQIGLLPGAKNYDKITRKNIVSQIDALAQVASPIIKQSAGLKSKNSTFVDALKKAGVYRS